LQQILQKKKSKGEDNIYYLSHTEKMITHKFVYLYLKNALKRRNKCTRGLCMSDEKR
jgi:hypothetical protein